MSIFNAWTVRKVTMSCLYEKVRALSELPSVLNIILCWYLRFLLEKTILIWFGFNQVVLLTSRDQSSHSSPSLHIAHSSSNQSCENSNIVRSFVILTQEFAGFYLQKTASMSIRPRIETLRTYINYVKYF